MSYLKPTKSSQIRNDEKKEDAVLRQIKSAQKPGHRKKRSHDLDTRHDSKGLSSMVTPVTMQKLVQNNHAATTSQHRQATRAKSAAFPQSLPVSARISIRMSMQSIEESKYEEEDVQVSEFTVGQLQAQRFLSQAFLPEDPESHDKVTCAFRNESIQEGTDEYCSEASNSEDMAFGKQVAFQAAIKQRHKQIGLLEKDSDAPSIQEFDEASQNSSGIKPANRNLLRMSSFGRMSKSGSVGDTGGFNSEDSFATANEKIRESGFADDDDDQENSDVHRRMAQSTLQPSGRGQFSASFTPEKKNSSHRPGNKFLKSQTMKKMNPEEEWSDRQRHQESFLDNGELFNFLERQYTSKKKPTTPFRNEESPYLNESVHSSRLSIQEKISMRKSQLKESMAEPEPISKILNVSDIASSKEDSYKAKQSRSRKRRLEFHRPQVCKFEEDDFLFPLRLKQGGEAGKSDERPVEEVGSSVGSSHRAIVADFFYSASSKHNMKPRAHSKNKRNREEYDSPRAFRSNEKHSPALFESAEANSFGMVEIEEKIRERRQQLDSDLEPKIDLKSQNSRLTQNSKEMKVQWYNFIKNSDDDTSSQLSQFTLHSKPSSYPTISSWLRKQEIMLSEKPEEERVTELLAMDFCRLTRMTWLLSPFIRPAKTISKIFCSAFKKSINTEGLSRVQALMVAFFNGLHLEALEECKSMRAIYLREKAEKVKPLQHSSYDMVLVYTVNLSLLLATQDTKELKAVLEEIPILVKNRNQLQFTVVELLTDFKAGRAFSKLKDLDYITYKLFRLHKLIALDGSIYYDDLDEDEQLGPEFYAREIQRQFAKIPKDEIIKQVEYFIFGALCAYRNGHFKEALDFINQAPIICNLGLDASSVDGMVFVEILKVIEIKLLSKIGQPEQAILEASSSLISSLGMSEFGQQKVYPFQQRLSSQWLLRSEWALDYYFKFTFRLLEFKKELVKTQVASKAHADLSKSSMLLQRLNLQICNSLFQLRAVCLQTGNYFQLMKLLMSLNTLELEESEQFQDFIRFLQGDSLSNDDRKQLSDIIKRRKDKKSKKNKWFVAWERFRLFSNPAFELGDLSTTILHEEDYLSKIEETTPQFYITLQYLLEYTQLRLNRILDPLFDAQEAAMVIKSKFQSGDTLYKSAIFKLLSATDLIAYHDLQAHEPIEIIFFKSRRLIQQHLKPRSNFVRTSGSPMDNNSDTEGPHIGDSLYTSSPTQSMIKHFRSTIPQRSQKSLETDEEARLQTQDAHPLNEEVTLLPFNSIISPQQPRPISPTGLTQNTPEGMRNTNPGGRSSDDPMIEADPLGRARREGASEEIRRLDMKLNRLSIEEHDFFSNEDPGSRKLPDSSFPSSLDNVINNEEDRTAYELMKGMIWDEESLAILGLACRMAEVRPDISNRISSIIKAKEEAQSGMGRFASILTWF